MVVLLVRILHLGLAVTGAAALLAVRPKVQLAEDGVKIAVSPDDLLAQFRRRFSQDPDDILAMDEHRLVRRFAGKEGPYSFWTALLARGPVKRAFETHVHRHLDALATQLAGYPDTGHPDRPVHAQ